ncbi:TRAP transporter small permease [Puniceibacterium sediminis]|uniref:TRAP transporter small permease protein n=1 Tax=Puniceibacterium sediminis TaxID=1608407 RepID=A0A238V058_9RHOB|nr:TRAP transporter small permease [Puniceibacterium sediminis]SNR27424.1 TRAP-type C4-dicarboxylate transport system, small permease component [Puniceibacterium sediminis]
MLRRIEQLLLDLAVAAVIGLGVLITATVLLRVCFNSGVPDAIVMVRELMVAAIVLPLAVTTAQRAHIAVEFVSNHLSENGQKALVVLGSVAGLFALAPLIYAGWREAAHAMTSGGFFFGELMLPKWPGRVIFLIGMSFCWLRLLLMVVADFKAMWHGEPLAETAYGTEG